jgi:acetyl-CoA C-acetyltransferase
MSGSVIVSSARTPIGKLSGALGACTAVISAPSRSKQRSSAPASATHVDHVMMGHVLQAGQNPHLTRLTLHCVQL